jgi:hypothetical protein
MKVTGILSLSNGDGLKYPYPVVVENLHRTCNNVIVGVDPNFPKDREVLEALGLPNLNLVDSTWNLDNRSGGTEIAIQMDKLVYLSSAQDSDWVVVMQADELVHEEDFKMLSAFMERHVDSSVTGFSMDRLYFWENLDTIRTDWEARLVRIFKPGTYSFMAEGTDKSGMFSAPVKPGECIDLPYKIYHYSRVDSPEVISRRVRNLDALFHQDETLIPIEELPDYDFVTREFDNFSKSGFPKEVSGKLDKFNGTHPTGVKEWYDV